MDPDSLQLMFDIFGSNACGPIPPEIEVLRTEAEAIELEVLKLNRHLPGLTVALLISGIGFLPTIGYLNTRRFWKTNKYTLSAFFSFLGLLISVLIILIGLALYQETKLIEQRIIYHQYWEERGVWARGMDAYCGEIRKPVKEDNP